MNTALTLLALFLSIVLIGSLLVAAHDAIAHALTRPHTPAGRYARPRPLAASGAARPAALRVHLS